MEEIVLNVENRTLMGKKAKRLFGEKKVPGVFYLGEENVSVQADEAPIRSLASSHTTHLIKVKFQDGKERRAILNDVQFDPVFGGILHFDLHGVKEGQKITLQIPVQLIGTPKGAKDGGILQHSIHRIRIQCDPDNVPEHIEVNISELGITDSIHIKDIKVEGVKVLDNPESSIVTVVPPPSLKEETAEAAAEAAAEQPAEPEVIGKSKKAEGEEEKEE
ncbi:MAG: 50S ribosomal protein L25 [Bacteroidetes bacterium]|nr:50S ribosomal protein L25 [Bacteroidota bacterium]